MSDDLKEFRLPIKTEVSISAELYVKASATAAELRPPMRVEDFVESVLEAAIANRPTRNIVFTWPPARESRDHRRRP